MLHSDEATLLGNELVGAQSDHGRTLAAAAPGQAPPGVAAHSGATGLDF